MTQPPLNFLHLLIEYIVGGLYMKNNKVLYYCHSSINEDDSREIGQQSSIERLQIKIMDQNDNDVVLDQLGFEKENELIKFVVHIVLRK